MYKKTMQLSVSVNSVSSPVPCDIKTNTLLKAARVLSTPNNSIGCPLQLFEDDTHTHTGDQHPHAFFEGPLIEPTGILHNVYFEVCLSQCYSKPNCTAISWSGQDGGCSTCFLKKNVTGVQHIEGYISTYVYTNETSKQNMHVRRTEETSKPPEITRSSNSFLDNIGEFLGLTSDCEEIDTESFHVVGHIEFIGEECDNGHVINVPHALYCETLCEYNMDCIAYVWFHSGACALKKHISGSRYERSAISAYQMNGKVWEYGPLADRLTLSIEFELKDEDFTNLSAEQISALHYCVFIKARTIFEGPGLPQYSKELHAKTLYKCITLCKQSYGCFAWTYNSEDQTCKLVREITDTIPAADSITSGFMHCTTKTPTKFDITITQPPISPHCAGRVETQRTYVFEENDLFVNTLGNIINWYECQRMCQLNPACNAFIFNYTDVNYGIARGQCFLKGAEGVHEETEFKTSVCGPKFCAADDAVNEQQFEVRRQKSDAKKTICISYIVIEILMVVLASN